MPTATFTPTPSATPTQTPTAPPTRTPSVRPTVRPDCEPSGFEWIAYDDRRNGVVAFTRWDAVRDGHRTAHTFERHAF